MTQDELNGFAEEQQDVRPSRKPYVPPTLVNLSNSDTAGKGNVTTPEVSVGSGPS